MGTCSFDDFCLMLPALGTQQYILFSERAVYVNYFKYVDETHRGRVATLRLLLQ